MGWAERAVWVDDAPGITDGRVCGNNAVSEGRGDHVEVAKSDDEVAGLGGGAELFGDFPGLCGTVACVLAVRLCAIRSMGLMMMSIGVI